MPEKVNDNIFKEETEPLEKKSSADFEFSETPETKQLASNINTLTDTINHDGVVRNNDLKKIEKSLGEIKIEVGGEQFTLEEFKSIPNIKENIKIWKEIMNGNFENIHRLTYLTPTIAKHLPEAQEPLYLFNLTTISDTVAEHLSKFQGLLDLSGLVTISDTVATHLSRHQGDLWLNSLATISDTSAEHLSKHQKVLELDGLTAISDTSAEHLSEHQGALFLRGLTTISDTSAKHLSEHTNLYVLGDDIEEKIKKFKQYKYARKN